MVSVNEIVKRLNKISILWILLITIILCNCSNRHFVNKDGEDFNFKKFDCKKLTDLKVSSAQIKKLNSETKRLFGVKEKLRNLCYTYRVNANNFGLVEAFNFSSHQTRFLFLFSERRIAVLQSEKKTWVLRPLLKKILNYLKMNSIWRQ